MRRIDWAAEAVENLETIVVYTAVFNPAAAARLHRRLTELANRLAEFPNRGRVSTNDTRELTIVPPYVLDTKWMRSAC